MKKGKPMLRVLPYVPPEERPKVTVPAVFFRAAFDALDELRSGIPDGESPATSTKRRCRA